MLNPNVIFIDLPGRVKGMVVKTFDEEECVTIVINSRLNQEQRLAAYEHELKHLQANDFDETDKSVDEIESERHIAI